MTLAEWLASQGKCIHGNLLGDCYECKDWERRWGTSPTAEQIADKAARYQAVAEVLGCKAPAQHYAWDTAPTWEQVEELRQCHNQAQFRAFLQRYHGSEIVKAASGPGCFTDPTWIVWVAMAADLPSRSWGVGHSSTPPEPAGAVYFVKD